MGKLIHSTTCSLDGYVADEQGDFSWAAPDEEVHAFINDLERPVGTYLFGRRKYEVMTYWETAHTEPEQAPLMLDFAELCHAAEMIVHSKPLEEASSAKTRIERHSTTDRTDRSTQLPKRRCLSSLRGRRLMRLDASD